MQKIPSQTSLQAIKTYRQALRDPKADLTVTSSGNVRFATLFERAGNRIADYFQKNSPDQRRAQARQAIESKFKLEFKLLNGRSPTNHSASTVINNVLQGTRIEDATQNVKVLKDALDATLLYVSKLSDLPQGKAVRVAWQANEEFKEATKRQADPEFSTKVAELSVKWKKEFHLSERSAYRLAFNAAALFKKHGIDTDEGRKILELAGRLHRQHGIPRESALRFAIDLQIPVKKLNIGFNIIERQMNVLKSKIPELKHCSPITQISAAICYFQLMETDAQNISELALIDKVRQRLEELKTPQQFMPTQCTMDQIHQGSHVRGYAAVGSEGLSTLAKEAKSLSNYDTFRRKENSPLPQVLKNFEHQFVTDMVRGNQYELRNNGKPDPMFTRHESERRQHLTAQAPYENYDKWAQSYQKFSGSNIAAATISAMQSQTLLGDVEVVTAEHLKNQNDYIVRAYGDHEASTVRYVADKQTRGYEDLVELQTRHEIRANLLQANLSTEARGTSKANVSNSPETYQIKLLRNDEWLPKMNHSNPALVRECVMTVPLNKLDQGSTDCSVTKLSETWDLMPDWEEWDRKRSQLV